ncbi:MAG: metalloregulator ArsR/SmtB family transcription factor [Phycisphaerae bacterium]|nr:metalloregulator ArsR/SmtB family transcription factor [Phycisphaerae bacterium]
MNEIDDNLAQEVAHILKSLAHPTRIGIVCLLSDSELTVGQIVSRLNLKQSIVSQHLNIMRLAGILSSSKRGAKVFYSISNPAVLGVLDCICRKCNTDRENNNV